MREALHAHVWPIMRMKVNPPPPSEAQSARSLSDNATPDEPSGQQVVGGCGLPFSATHACLVLATDRLLSDAKQGTVEEQKGEGEEAVESFEELFSRFAAMKGLVVV